MRIDTSRFVVGKVYEFTSRSHPDWIGFRVRAEPGDMMSIVHTGQKNNRSEFKMKGVVIGRSGFANGNFWTECVYQRGTFGKWFREHGL